MEKFTKFQKKGYNLPKAEYLYKGNIMNIIKFDNWEMIEESDMVLILPYIIEKEVILLRKEYIPTYKYRELKNNKNIDYFLTPICGTLEKGENPEKTVKRELYEEAGIILSDVKDINIENSFHLSKGNTAKFFPAFLNIREGEYKEVIAPGDGSKEEKISKTIQIPLKDIDNIIYKDIATAYLLNTFKLLNIENEKL